MRIYAIRNWIEQSYKQVKDELGWADFQVRSDTAICRYQALVSCAFSFCWATWFRDHPAPRAARAWLSPWTALQRWWPAWSKAPSPPQLQALISSVAAGCGLHLYIPN